MPSNTPTPPTAALALSLGAAVLYGIQARSPPSAPRTAAKTASTALLSALSALRGGPVLLTGALALGAAGDAVLAFDDGEPAFLGGLACFLAAHALYIALFLAAPGDGRGGLLQLLAGGRGSAYAVVAVVLLAPAVVGLLMPRVGGALRLPVLVYSAAVVAMVLSAAAAAAAVDDGDDDRVVVGAVLFAVSDAILAAERFLVAGASPHRAWMQHGVWVLYYSGQLLITLGFVAGV
ncbi:YhhN-like protein [Phialemonium atrogriseum]|uniref:YhhN-like protein n=1 Tax=Phialemonium atrogriseum TaxID=1093897 RepID=A0AAJ0FGH2_9PEZI|nr:YhhN-like protein [Phialemonium atrogriseum]KAK1766617.1 YhhN-like protein [Phialemonium atrogriseum]